MMLLSVSNIAWETSQDKQVYARMKELGYTGLEIAPTRIFAKEPYNMIEKAKTWSKALKEECGFGVPSMQSIWFGRSEMLFGTDEERDVLLKYTKKAIDFAAGIECKNLVFGCPRNRNMPKDADVCVAVEFFKELGDYAYQRGTCIGMEANPTIYNTNFINDTKSALNLVERVDSKGFLLNLDVGTMVQNEESVEDIVGQVHLINHIHISEPGLAPIEERVLHQQIFEVLKSEKYKKYISIEMGKKEDVHALDVAMEYVRKVFL